MPCGLPVFHQLRTLAKEILRVTRRTVFLEIPTEGNMCNLHRARGLNNNLRGYIRLKKYDTLAFVDQLNFNQNIISYFRI